MLFGVAVFIGLIRSIEDDVRWLLRPRTNKMPPDEVARLKAILKGRL